MLPSPPSPEPHTVEIEATNHCSARCQFCPHPRMRRPKGFMQLDSFSGLLDDLAEYREGMWLNSHLSANPFPRVNFAGLGEPTLHKHLPKLVGAAVKRDFPVHMVTNGAHLRPRLVSDLVENGISRVAISLHTLDPSLYSSLMNLSLDRTLPLIRRAVPEFLQAGVAVELWRVLPPVATRTRDRFEDAYDDFVQSVGGPQVLGPSEPWDRDGTVRSIVPVADDSAIAGIWCHNMFFTLPIAWNGDVTTCCVDYAFMRQTLGNAFEEGISGVQRRRADDYRRRELPVCKTCTKWLDREYSEVAVVLGIDGKRDGVQDEQ